MEMRNISIHREGISQDLLPVVGGAATTLAFRMAANVLLESVRRGLENVLTIKAAADWDQGDSSEVSNRINSCEQQTSKAIGHRKCWRTERSSTNDFVGNTNTG